MRPPLAVLDPGPVKMVPGAAVKQKNNRSIFAEPKRALLPVFFSRSFPRVSLPCAFPLDSSRHRAPPFPPGGGPGPRVWPVYRMVPPRQRRCLPAARPLSFQQAERPCRGSSGT